MSLSPQFLDELRSRTLLSALIGRTTKLQKAGREFRACCPFHNEKTPSFYVNDDKGFYHCFGCSAHGDAIRWMTDQRGLPFMDAVKELAQTAGMEMPAMDRQSADKAERAKGLHEVCADAATWFSAQLQGIGGAEARAVLEKRGIKSDTIKEFGLGYAPDSRGKLKDALKDYGEPLLVEAGLLISVEDKTTYDRFRGRLMIPIRDPRGRTIAFGGRVIGNGEPKYLNSPETPVFDKGRTLYNLDRAAPASRKTGRVLVVEGYMDVIALHQVGIEEAVAPLGTALTEAQLERLWRLSATPILCFDGDPPGQAAAIRAIGRALPTLSHDRRLSFLTLPPGQDPDDLIRSGGRAAMEALLESPEPLVERLWRHELNAELLNTPEARAGLGSRLRAHAREIRDEDLRNEYLGTFNRMVWDFSHPERPSESFTRFSSKTPKRAVSPRLLAIAQHGIDQATYIPALMAGLVRFPDMIGPLGELLVRLPINSIRLRQTRESMLDSALDDPNLETEGLKAILRREGLATVLEALERVTLAFSFLSRDGEPEQARKELGTVADALAVAPELEADIALARERWVNDAEERDYDEFERLLKLRAQVNETFRDSMMPDEDLATTEGN